MKNWNAAQLVSVDLNETAHGLFSSCTETCILYHGPQVCPDPDKKPETPDVEDKPVDQLS